MKKKFLFLMALLAVSLLALAEMTVYVYKKDGTKVPYVASTIDSIGFVNINANGHEWVDLGLPSGTLWATCNVGANSPEDYGDYFAWGETTPKSTYNESTYKWYDGSSDTYTKYCTDSDYGTVDNKTTLDLSDDAAYVNWGGDWRMPELRELNELVNTNYTTWTWTTKKGVNGYKITSKTNGNSIFLPAAGSAVTGGSIGHYWSSNLITGSSYVAHGLYFASDDAHHSSREFRFFGYPVRPIVRPVFREIFTLGFDANGGSGSMFAVELERNESKNIPANTFTRHGYRFIGWNTAADGSGTAYTDQATITVTANMTLYAQWEVLKDTGIADGHEWVDLGLPSGTKWATMNVGANSPEDYGNYFAWGETTPKSSYTTSNYSYSSNPTTLPLDRDAAYTNWGTSWRMPTDAELDELIANCTWTWTTQNGVSGRKVTSKVYGNSIFLPAAGYSYDSSLYYAGSFGSYWSSSLCTDSSSSAYGLGFDSNIVSMRDIYNRDCGRSVRPVLRE